MPLNELAVPNRVVGEREVRRALGNNSLKKLFFALDGDMKRIESLLAEARKTDVEIEEVDSKLKLGRACAIDRSAAVAGLLKGA